MGNETEVKMNREELLAAQVVAMREALEKADDLFARSKIVSGMTVITQSIAIDTSAAEAILRERDAKMLEEAAEFIERNTFGKDTHITLRRMAAERRAGK